MFIKPLITILSGALLASASAIAQAPKATDAEVPGWLEKDYAELTSLFAGRWDTDRHVFFAEQAGMALSEIAPRQHIKIDRVSGDEDGAVSFMAERTVDGEMPASLVHVFTIDANAQAIRQSIAVPLEEGGVQDVGCDVLWSRRGGQFQGEAVGAGCDTVFPRPEGAGPLEATFALSETEYWVTAERGDAMIEARFRRARPFECWTAILRGAEHGDSGEGMRDWDFRRGVSLHDQGGVAELITDEEPPRKIRLRLRNVDWPYGTNRPSLTLYVLEGDNDRAVSYAWNEGNAERIGINLRWLQASCTHAPDEAPE